MRVCFTEWGNEDDDNIYCEYVEEGNEEKGRCIYKVYKTLIVGNDKKPSDPFTTITSNEESLFVCRSGAGLAMCLTLQKTVLHLKGCRRCPLFEGLFRPSPVYR